MTSIAIDNAETKYSGKYIALIYFFIEFIGWSSSMNCVTQCQADMHICITVHSSDPYFVFFSIMLDIHKMFILSYNEEGAPVSLLN